MAKLVVTFTKGYGSGEADSSRANYQVARGDSARTDLITIGAAHAESTKSAADDDDFVQLEAGAECYVKVGLNPVAVDGEGWHLSAGGIKDLSVEAGYKVSVIVATTVIG